MRRCKNRHRNYWVIRDDRWPASHAILWCYKCGAIRSLPNEKHWTYPEGTDGENPAVTQHRKAKVLA